MTDQDNARLRQTIAEAAAKVQRFQDRSLGEQNTKPSLVEPILEALGWDIRDPDEVHREFKPTSKDNPVDYALAILRKPRLFVEAKGLGESLGDRKWIAQVLLYATVAGVEWCVLTDGDEYRFYNATAPVDAEEKLFCRIRLSASPEDEAIRTLGLISRANLEGNLLDALWSAHFVDRRVKEVLRRLLEARDKAFVKLIRRRCPKLTPREIVESLRRLDVRIESPPTLTEGKPARPRPAVPAVRKPKPEGAVRKPGPSRQQLGQVPLAQLIGAGLLPAPVRLFRHYLGQMLEAQLLADGRVEFQGTVYASCSTAAEAARKSVTGRRMNTNGWSFWQYLDAKGAKCTLDSVRKAYLAGRQG